MGLLTNPNAEEANRLVVFLQNHGTKLGILSYLIGIIWLGFLANADYNLKTYFSENALLPGLVVENFNGAHRVDHFLKELMDQDAKPEKITPQFIQNMLIKVKLPEVELQNFTVIDPVTKQKGDELSGTNVFGIMRAKRASGTESIVLNAPLFPRNGSNRKNLVSIALMLALAEYFQGQVYWAKDIVFLVSEGHVGSLAWVKGHQEMYESNDILKFESVRTKAGNIQAAINLIMEGINVCSMETKFHGINGQLPNLDLVNLLNKFMLIDAQKRPDWEQDIWKLIAYMQIQATGTPTASHGFFLKYGIESVTLVGKSSKTCKSKHSLGFSEMGRMMEAVFRSLNNLLERLHQSYFFYLKTTPNRFISISLYFPPLGLILFPILLKGACVWLTKKNLDMTQALFMLTTVLSVSIFCRWSLSNLDRIALLLYPELQISANLFLQIVLGLAAFQYLFTFLLLRNAGEDLVDGIYCFCLMGFATALYSLALFNPSLVILVGIASAPILTMLFKFEPKQRLWLFGLVSSFLLGLVVDYYSVLETPVNKYFYEAELYGNFLFDFMFILVIPVVSSVSAIL